MTECPKYSSGEKIDIGDLVRYDESEGTIELIVTPESPDWESYWHELGQGVMVKCPKYGRVFVPFDDEHLEFIKKAAV